VSETDRKVQDKYVQRPAGQKASTSQGIPVNKDEKVIKPKG